MNNQNIYHFTPVNMLQNLSIELLKKVQPLIPDSLRVLQGKAIAVLEYWENIAIITEGPHWQIFLEQCKDQISDLLYIANVVETEQHGTEYTHHDHHFTQILNILKQKSVKSKNTEYANIKLAEVSGMTEFINTFDMRQIESFLESLKAVENTPKKMQEIKKWLWEKHLYDNVELSKDYSIWLSLSSREELLILIQHIHKRWSDGAWAYRFRLTSSRRDIIRIVSQLGYFQDDISQAFEFIIENEDRSDDDCDYA